MWQLTVFSYLFIFHGHASSQPITEDSGNGRQVRQLDFGECCPCPGAGQAASPDVTVQGSSWATSEPALARARDLDDCPCRPRYFDADGASSIFSPTSMRSDGTIVRPVEKNDEPKPLLHPEVDLASSVLQTLREATDEEYQDALAREAARSMGKAAEETIFGDAIPEASTGNIVTIIVNPKQAANLDDETPQETHVQESPCIQPALGVKTNIGKIRVASKPSSLLRDIFGLPRLNKPDEISQKEIFDMDSSIGASNINEQMMHDVNDQLSNRGTQGRRKYVPLIKLNLNDEGLELPFVKGNSDHNYRTMNKIPNFKLSALNKDMVSSRSSNYNKINHLPLIPQIKKYKLFSKQEESNDIPLNNIQEQVAGRRNFLNTKIHLKNILEQTRPVGLKNFLKLKDVELIPLKDIADNAAKRPKLSGTKLDLPPIFSRRTDTFSSGKYNKSPKEESGEVIAKKTHGSNDEIFEPEVNSNNIIERTLHISENCNSQGIESRETNVKEDKDNIVLPEIMDTAPSSSNIQSTEANNEVDNSHPHKIIDNIDDCVIKTLPDTEKNLVQTTESYSKTLRTNENKLDLDSTTDMKLDNIPKQENQVTNDDTNSKDCDDSNNEFDAMTDSSNNVNSIFKPAGNDARNSDDSLENKNTGNEETCSREQKVNDSFENNDSISEKNTKKPLSIDEALSSVKENIKKKLEHLKKHKAISRDQNMFDEDVIKEDEDTDHEESAPVINETCNDVLQNEGQENEKSIQPLKSDNCNEEDIENATESHNVISMQDLQKISDSMLQREEQDRELKNAACVEPIKTVIDTKKSLPVNSREADNRDTEQSANTQNELMVPIHSEIIHDKIENSEENSSQTDIANQADTHSDASDDVNTQFPCNSISETPLINTEIMKAKVNSLKTIKSPLSDLQEVIKLNPLPALDDIKLKLTNLFDSNSEDIEVLSGSREDSETGRSNAIMAADASTTSFQSKFPPLRLEDINLDILNLNPHSSLLSTIPNIDLHSYRTKLPLPNDLRLKPMKLRSALEDNGNIFGATVTVGGHKSQPNKKHKTSRVSNNLWENIPNLNDRKTDFQKFLNVPHKTELLRNRLSDLSDSTNDWKNVQHTLESRIKEASKIPINLHSNNLFEFISRNHEDIDDKLKAIHIDLNDRIETMRNNFKDISILGTSETRNRNGKSSTNFSNRNKGKPLTVETGRSKPIYRTQSNNKNTANSRRWEQQRQNKIEFPQKLHNQKKLKMFSSASVAVPKTIEVPELKATLTKSLQPPLQRTLSVNPNTRNVATSSENKYSAALWKPANNSLRNSNSALEKKIIPFKDSKIKVSFSTTTRPSTAVQSRNTPSSTDLHDTPQISHTSLVNHIDRQRNTGRFNEPTLGTRKDFQSRSKMLDSPLIQKVKETLKSRLSKENSPITFKKADIRSHVDKGLYNNNKDDMLRAASENTDLLVRQTLKEDVTYKCKMICSKE